MSQRKQHSVIDRCPRIVHRVNRSEICANQSVDCFKFRNYIRLSIGQIHRGLRETTAERRIGLSVRRHQVQIESEVSVGLSCYSIGISEERNAMGIHVAYAQGRLCSEPVLHRQIALLDVWIPEIRHEDVNRLAPGSGACGGRSRERVWIRDQRRVVSKAKSGEKYELPRDSVR